MRITISPSDRPGGTARDGLGYLEGQSAGAETTEDDQLIGPEDYLTLITLTGINTMNRLYGLGLGAACLLLCGSARAGYMYVFTDHNTTAIESNFNANPGDAVTVDVFLEETNSGTDISTYGLVNAGARVSVVNPQPAHPAVYQSAADLQPDTTDFDVNTAILDNPPTSGFISDFAEFFSNPTGVTLSDGNTGQLIGIFTLHVPGTALGGEVTTIEAGRVQNNPPSQDDILGDLNATDVTPSTPTDATITVAGGILPPTAVPEPSSVTLAMIYALCGAAGYVWRRRTVVLQRRTS